MTIKLTKKSVARAFKVKPADVEITDHRIKVARNGNTYYYEFIRLLNRVLYWKTAVDRNFTRRDMEE